MIQETKQAGLNAGTPTATDTCVPVGHPYLDLEIVSKTVSRRDVS